MVCMSLAAFPAPAYLREEALDRQSSSVTHQLSFFSSSLIDLHVVKRSLYSAAVFEEVSCPLFNGQHGLVCGNDPHAAAPINYGWVSSSYSAFIPNRGDVLMLLPCCCCTCHVYMRLHEAYGFYISCVQHLSVCYQWVFCCHIIFFGFVHLFFSKLKFVLYSVTDGLGGKMNLCPGNSRTNSQAGNVSALIAGDVCVLACWSKFSSHAKTGFDHKMSLWFFYTSHKSLGLWCIVALQWL